VAVRELLADPQVWLSFLTLVLLEIVLGIDNIIFLAVLVERLPKAQRGSARLLGLGFAMLTRIGLLFSVVWLATLRDPWLRAFGTAVSARGLILFGGGLFLIVNTVRELREMFNGKAHTRKPGGMNSFAMIVVQIGIIDIVFSLDSVFTAVGLAQHIEVMVAAIVISVLATMLVAASVGRFIERHPSIKVLALAFLALVGAALIADSLERDLPPGYLYFAFVFAVAVEWINIRLRGPVK